MTVSLVLVEFHLFLCKTTLKMDSSLKQIARAAPKCIHLGEIHCHYSSTAMDILFTFHIVGVELDNLKQSLNWSIVVLLEYVRKSSRKLS